MTGSVLIIAGLFYFSNWLQQNPNYFIRVMPPHVAIPDRIKDMKYNSYYIGGGTNSRFYLCNSTAPGVIIAMGLDLKDTSSNHINMMSVGSRIARSLKIFIDSPGVNMFEGVSPIILRGTLGNPILLRPSCNVYFNLAGSLSSTSFILRMVDAKMHQNVLVKQERDTLIRREKILEKQVDGVFCTDGSISVQPDSNRVVYTYNYRNEFICMDTNLNIKFRAKTIDTVSHVKFGVGFIQSERKMTLTSPPVHVNKEVCVSGNYLFIHSGLQADNEDAEEFSNSSVIDMYSLKNGKYILSFRLPDYYHKKIKDFRVFGNTLIALYDHYVYSYELRIPAKQRE